MHKRAVLKSVPLTSENIGFTSVGIWLSFFEYPKVVINLTQMSLRWEHRIPIRFSSAPTGVGKYVCQVSMNINSYRFATFSQREVRAEAFAPWGVLANKNPFLASTKGRIVFSALLLLLVACG